MMRRGVPFLILALLSVLLGACQKKSEELPVLGKIPKFNLTDQNHQSFGLQNLEGKIWVADFIFTSCGGTCPMLTQRMKEVQRSIQEMKNGESRFSVKIVSFSVDPERDTPDKLLAYSQRFESDPKIWVFLTGPLDQVTQTVVQGFKIAMGKVTSDALPKKYGEEEIFEVVHGEKFVLIDDQGRIRGYYDSDSSGIKKILIDMQSLAEKGSS
jgi:protein SCO1